MAGFFSGALRTLVLRTARTRKERHRMKLPLIKHRLATLGLAGCLLGGGVAGWVLAAPGTATAAVTTPTTTAASSPSTATTPTTASPSGGTFHPNENASHEAAESAILTLRVAAINRAARRRSRLGT